MKILVTGGAGFIGSNIVEKLLEKRHEVVVIDNLTTGNIENIREFLDRIKFINGSIMKKEDVERAGKVDYILHQAAIPSVPKSVKNPVETSKTNIIGTLNVLEFARRKEVKRIVLASSSSIYGDSEKLPKKEDMPYNPKSPYALAKVTNEMHAKLYYNLYGVETICLRYFNVYGKKQNPNSEYSAVIPKFIKLMMENKNPIIYGDGKQTRDFTYVEDVVEANLKAISAGKEALGKAINIAGGKRISLIELIDLLNKIMNKELKPMFKESRKGDVKHSLADVKKAKELLGWEAKIGVEEGLKRTAEWYKSII